MGSWDAVGTGLTYSPEETLELLDELRTIPAVRALESWTHLTILKEHYDRPLQANGK
jgi:hypothetical protein